MIKEEPFLLESSWNGKILVFFQCLDTNLTAALMLELTKANLVPLCVDQNANHVIQKVVLKQ